MSHVLIELGWFFFNIFMSDILCDLKFYTFHSNVTRLTSDGILTFLTIFTSDGIMTRLTSGGIVTILTSGGIVSFSFHFIWYHYSEETLLQKSYSRVSWTLYPFHTDLKLCDITIRTRYLIDVALSYQRPWGACYLIW